MNENSSRRKFLSVITLIIITLLTLSIAAYCLYLREYKKHLLKKRAAFDVIIDNAASLGNIESIEYIICGEGRLIEPHEDKNGVVVWSDYISTPEQLLIPEGAPCAVEILITKEGKTTSYPADRLFDCPDCSGWHHYNIIENTAVYSYTP